jgi:hypothetical protein
LANVLARILACTVVSPVQLETVGGWSGRNRDAIHCAWIG